MTKSMTDILFSFIVLICAFASIESKLRIMAPEGLKAKFPNTIPAIPGNYGRIPYGFYTRGKLHYDFISAKEENYACVETNMNFIDAQSYYNVDYYPILLVDQGKNCSFVEMTRIVQRKGGKMAIIISANRTDENALKQEIVPDDGTARDVTIPTLVISRNDGKEITDYMKEKSEPVYLELEFPTRQSTRVQMDLYFNVMNKDAYVFMAEFRPFYELISKDITFTPHYITNTYAYQMEEEELQHNCILDGKYCLPSYPLSTSNNGKFLIEEGLFHYCIYEKALKIYHDVNLFFNFVANYNENECHEKLGTSSKNPKCARNSLKQIGIDEYLVDKCVEDVTVNKKADIIESENLMAMINNVNMIPILLVNGKKIYGALNIYNTFHTVCSSFYDQPTGCKEYYKPVVDSSFGWFQITLIILGTLLINVFLIYICRRYIHEQLQNKLSRDSVEFHGIVDKNIENYFSFKDPVPLTNK